MKVSVVIVTYRRVKNLERIIQAWLKETPDVWLCDCTKAGFKTKAKIKIIRATPDPGNKIRHAVATMTGGDIVIKADDDILPRPGLVKDFIKYSKALPPAILSIHGRKFNGVDYYNHTKMFGAKGLRNAAKVDFVGVMTCTPRQFLAMDLKGCATEVEDLFWQMKCYPKAPKYVIPTQNFMNLPECKDKGRLCADQPGRKIRRSFYKTWYERNYK